MAVQVPASRLSTEGVFAQLDALTGSGYLSGAKVHLYQSTFVPSSSSVYADFVAAEADFTGYAEATLTWSATGYDSAGNPVGMSSRAFFQATDAVAPNIIGGAWITHDETGPPAVHTVVQYFPFNPAINMTTALASLGIVVAAMLPGQPGYASIDF